MKIYIKYLALLLAALPAIAPAQNKDTTLITVPLGGNGWLSKNASVRLGDNGLTGWSAAGDTVYAYVRFENTGDVDISLKLSVPAGTSKLALSFNGTRLEKTVTGSQEQTVPFGNVKISSAGYKKFALYGLNRTGSVYANVSAILLDGAALKGAAYVKDNKGNYFYWGHRGPSVHLNYPAPDAIRDKVAWFYNEVTVPVGQDVLGSYFMADGFTGGYFGMQVNSPAERHVLFSVWSPFQTDDPKNIPDSLKIKLLKKGSTVHAGEFGSEGSGGQSYMNYPWVAGKTYVFLIHAVPDTEKRTTTFTAYFKEKSQTEWQLIASFVRPRSGFYLQHLYSFLENFNPQMGEITRKVYFGNQWLADNSGHWYPVNKATFTGDATAGVNYRKDYGGGVEKDRFYLRNCGFFDDYTPLKTPLNRQQGNTNPPAVNFNQLP